MERIYLWLSANKLSLNTTKTKCMLFHYKQHKIYPNEYPVIKINDSVLQFEQQYKFLGVVLDDTLSWNYHINTLSTKVSKFNGLLSKLKHFFPTKILLLIYNTLILSRLTYGIILWGFGSLDRLKLIQKKIIRNINKSPFYSHTQPICKSLKLLLLDDIFKVSCLKFYYKYQKNNIPWYFKDIEIIKPYIPQRYNFRMITPTQFPDFVTDQVNFRPEFELPKTKKKSSENRIAYYLPMILNYKIIPNSVLEKINTHSLQGVSYYFKNQIINNYNIECTTVNCFVCNGNSNG